MSNFERKFGKYAIPNLTIILIGCYVIGYIMSFLNNDFLGYLTLNAHLIFTKGQVWRVISWIIVPPDSFDIFTIIMLFVYYSIGTTMERTLGTYKYNVFIFRGMFITVIAAFICYGICYFFPNVMLTIYGKEVMQYLMSSGSVEWTSENVLKFLSYVYDDLGMATVFSTYYINMSIFLAFAIVYPEMQVLLMFVIPVKVKWLGILDLVLLGYSFVIGNVFVKFSVGAALINIAIFYFGIKRLSHLRPKEVKRRMEYKQKVTKAQALTRHKCAICGQTEQDNPDLEFRFCSKCNGNYEYCSNHLYTHEHVK